MRGEVPMGVGRVASWGGGSGREGEGGEGGAIS